MQASPKGLTAILMFTHWDGGYSSQPLVFCFRPQSNFFLRSKRFLSLPGYFQFALRIEGMHGPFVSRFFRSSSEAETLSHSSIAENRASSQIIRTSEPISICCRASVRFSLLHWPLLPKTWVLFNCNMTPLLQCPPAKEGVFAILETVQEIAADAFSKCSKLAEIYLPGTLKEIGPSAFLECASLAQAEFPNALKTVEDNAFVGCY